MFTIFRTSIFLICRSVCDRSGRTTPSGLYREALRRKCPALYAFVSLKHCLLCESSHCLCCESHYENCCLHSESCHCLLWWSHQVPTLWVPPLSTLCHHCLWLPVLYHKPAIAFPQFPQIPFPILAWSLFLSCRSWTFGSKFATDKKVLKGN